MEQLDQTDLSERASLAKLTEIAHAILDPRNTLSDLIPQIVALTTLLEIRSTFDFATHTDLTAGETVLETGKAVSPLVAAFCAREVFRTAAFVRGLGQAIKDAACEVASKRAIRVLYAGCGPFALLALPLMAAFSSQQVQFALIDLHPESLDCARQLLEGLGFAAHVNEYLCVDATRYQIPADATPDVIVSETMNVCLNREPQVSIARNLLGQAPQARMVPQSVTVEACLLDKSKELTPVGSSIEPVRDRVYLGEVFRLDAQHIARWGNMSAKQLPAATINIPSPLPERYQARLLTKIVVYGETCLSDYHSSLNLPQCFPGKPKFLGGEALQFSYQLGSNPRLAFEVCSPSLS